METSIFHKLSNILWVVAVVLVVLLAIHVSVGRLVMSSLSSYQAEILQELNQRVPFTIEAQQVSGDWQSFTPILVFSGLRLSVPGADEPIELSEGRIGIDVLGSLFTRTPQMTHLRLAGLTLRGEISSEGKLQLDGFNGGGGAIGVWVQNFLLNIERISLVENRLLLTLPQGEASDLDLNLDLFREGSQRQVEAELVSDRGARISAKAIGVGNPFRPDSFSGELYLDIESSDLAAVQKLLPVKAPKVRARGALALELWLSWDEGEPGLTGRIDARDLQLSDAQQTWQVSLQSVSMSATLVERKNRWTLFGNDLQIHQDLIDFRLPRLQLDIWGDALRVRAADVSMAPLNQLLTGLENAPQGLVDVFDVLRPRGLVSALQLSVGDVGNPGGDWELEANFEGVAVDSWNGAPGVTSAAGYLSLASSGGFVLLDSQEFVLDFPKIYSRPLAFEDIFGTINIEWDQDDLLLSSELITASGEEGVATALFGLNIPWQKNHIGLEMDLLVGLSDTHPVHREKYLPFILQESLLNWLDASIGEGTIEQGAFLWRGSLRPGAAPLRTVQLFFNIADTDLKFDPAWPALSGVDSIVLIDDANVSVWAEQASLFDLSAAWMSAESWVSEEGKMMLAVDGDFRGPASDGLVLLTESPIGELLGDGFDQWTLAGELEIDLSLQLSLTAGAIDPVVDVQTRWLDVDVGIEPGNLRVKGVNGELRYSSAQGLYSPELTGTLWGKPVTASIGQRPLRPGAAYDARSSVVEVLIDGSVDTSSVQRWLQLDALAFARGRARVNGRVDIAPGAPPVLTLESTLAGVSLDFPQPWNKVANEETRLQLELPLAGQGSVLAIDLDGQVNLNLDIGRGTLNGGTLAFHQAAIEPVAGLLQISGHLAQMNVQEWLKFIEDYFSGAMQAVLPQPGYVETPAAIAVDTLAQVMAAADMSSVGPVPQVLAVADGSLGLEVNALQVDQMKLYGQALSDVVFSLSIKGQQWEASAATDWLRGNLSLNAIGADSRLDIEYLDLAGLAQLDLAGSGEPSVLELPELDVTLAGLRKGDQDLGELEFHLRTEGPTLYASNITGSLASMRLLPESPGRLTWSQGEDALTDIKLALVFEDLGETLQQFGYQRILETRRGALDLGLQWPGAPQDFALQRGVGALTVSLGSGSFLDAPSTASGALRVVSVLNLADIVSRLSLTHMFESGIPFDSVKGDIYLHGGTIEVADMEVQGSSSFRFSGVSAIAERSLEGELVATLPVANNLPWVAALAGGLPVAAGVFVVSKVFEKQFNRLTSAVYTVDGSWDEPQVTFDRIFDNAKATNVDLPDTGAGEQEAGLKPVSGRPADIAPTIPDPQEVQPGSSP